MKCRCGKNCLHNGEEVSVFDCVRPKTGWYYHVDCYETKMLCQEIYDTYIANVGKDIVYTQLRGIINKIVYDKNVDPKFFLFALKYYINNRLTINHPAGLYYIIQNDRVKDAWDKEVKRKVKQELKEQTITIKDENIVPFTYKVQKKKGIEDILGD